MLFFFWRDYLSYSGILQLDSCLMLLALLHAAGLKDIYMASTSQGYPRASDSTLFASVAITRQTAWESDSIRNRLKSSTSTRQSRINKGLGGIMFATFQTPAWEGHGNFIPTQESQLPDCESANMPVGVPIYLHIAVTASAVTLHLANPPQKAVSYLEKFGPGKLQLLPGKLGPINLQGVAKDSFWETHFFGNPAKGLSSQKAVIRFFHSFSQWNMAQLCPTHLWVVSLSTSKLWPTLSFWRMDCTAL